MSSWLEFEWNHASTCVQSKETPASNTHANTQPLGLSSLYWDWNLGPCWWMVPPSFMLQPTWRVSWWVDLLQILYHVRDNLPLQTELVQNFGSWWLVELWLHSQVWGTLPKCSIPCGFPLPHSQLFHHLPPHLHLPIQESLSADTIRGLGGDCPPLDSTSWSLHQLYGTLDPSAREESANTCHSSMYFRIPFNVVKCP